MTLAAATVYLIRALTARARSWVPCEVSPGELAREYDGPPPALAGRVMRDEWLRDAVLNNVERAGYTIRYDRRRRTFLMGRGC